MRPPVSHGFTLAAALLLSSLGLLTSPTPIAAQSGGGPETADSSYFRAYHSVPRDTVTQDVYDGWKQYMIHCARCHGDFGVGTSFAPALVESVKPEGTIPTLESFIQTVCAGRMDKGMPAWCAAGLEMSAMQTMHAYLVERANGKVGLGRPAVSQR